MESSRMSRIRCVVDRLQWTIEARGKPAKAVRAIDCAMARKGRMLWLEPHKLWCKKFSVLSLSQPLSLSFFLHFVFILIFVLCVLLFLSLFHQILLITTTRQHLRFIYSTLFCTLPEQIACGRENMFVWVNRNFNVVCPSLCPMTHWGLLLSLLIVLLLLMWLSKLSREREPSGDFAKTQKITFLTIQSEFCRPQR